MILSRMKSNQRRRKMMKEAVSVLTLMLLAVAPAWADVSVSGKGSVKAVPDQAVVQIAVVTEAEEANPALDENGVAARKLKGGLTNLKLDEKDVCTSGFYLQSRYSHPKEGEPKFIGYTVQHDITITVRQISQVGKVLDSVVKGGANRVHSVAFTFSNADELLDQAREAAVLDAKRKAELYVKTAGAKLGRLKSISEQGNSRVYYAESMDAARSMPSGQPVSPGERSLSVSISVVWDVK
jgi:uncharacterized protein YggE